ncbi:MAG: peptidylprolyl isomerase [Nocardiaceae bacterium]|nr:peptidylprolyl isomerase [Nocardiaceae bacterium]
MPTNQQRRAAAKRKLQRQLERRAERARLRRRNTVIGAIVGVVVIAAAVGGVLVFKNSSDDKSTQAASTTSAAPSQPADPMPARRATPFPDLVDCKYDPTPAPAAKPVNPPAATGIATVGDANGIMPQPMKIETAQGPITMWMRIADSPCTVNNFISLARQGYFNGTTCHRMTSSAELKVLQCGDPTGSGTGGPGYQFADEFPVDQPDKKPLLTYGRGMIAMANAGPGTNGSQFFLVYGDSKLPPSYTVFGWVDQNDLATLDKIAQQGIVGGGEDGQPVAKVEITAVTG